MTGHNILEVNRKMEYLDARNKMVEQVFTANRKKEDQVLPTLGKQQIFKALLDPKKHFYLSTREEPLHWDKCNHFLIDLNRGRNCFS